MLQFITNEKSTVSPVNQILQVIEGGCRWVQIRQKQASDDEIRQIFKAIRDKASETLTTIIINDRVDLVKELGQEGVGGVHLGLTDMPAAEARYKLGPEAIIGVTAHNFEEVETYKGLDIDYIGIGPFADTDTKTDLAPILGLEGLAEIILRMKDAGIITPCVAVGGIKIEDIKPLLSLGVNGVAISGAIANSNDISEAAREALSQLPIQD